MLRRALLAAALVLSGAAAANAAPVEGDRTEGSAAAPVTVTAYLSPTCPHCAHWWLEDWPAFKAAYVDPGKARMVWRELPTDPPQLASAAILIARCAPENRYEAALQVFMQGQAGLYETRQPAPWLRAGGRAAGLDDAGVEACLSDAANLAELEARVALAQADGVTSTPSLLVNGEKLAEPTLAALRAAVDARLAASAAP